MAVGFHQAWSKSQWTVLTEYLSISTNVRRYQTHHRWHFFLSGGQRTGAHALCVQQSYCCGTLDFLSPEPCPTPSPDSPKLNALITVPDLGSHIAAYDSWVNKTEEIKQRLVDCCQCTNKVIQHLSVCDFRVSPFCQVVQKHKLFEVAE